MTDHNRNPRVVNAQLALGAAVCALFHAGIACAVFAQWPVFGAIPVEALPAVMVGFSLGFSTLFAPLFVNTQKFGRDSLFPTVYFILWQCVILSFVLSVLSRLVPLGAPGIAQAVAWVALTGWTALLLHARSPALCNALMFVWLIGLPAFGYFMAELFLSSPAGAAGWAVAQGDVADRVRAVEHALLNFSPGTGAIGALQGALADGSEYSTKWLLVPIILALCVTVPKALAWRRAGSEAPHSGIAGQST